MLNFNKQLFALMGLKLIKNSFIDNNWTLIEVSNYISRVSINDLISIKYKIS